MRMFAVCACVVAALLSSIPAEAQVKKEADQTVQVLQLKFAEAEEVVPLINELFGAQPGQKPRVMVTAHVLTNALIVRASEMDLETIKGLLKTIDVPAQKNARIQTVTFTLEHVLVGDKAFGVLLKDLFGEDKSLKFAQAPAGNQLIVRGSPESIETVRAMLEFVDRSAAPKPVKKKSLRVRVVWLMAGEGMDDSPLAPKNLGKVVETLAELGIEDPRMVGQALVTVDEGSQFQVVGVPATKALAGANWIVAGETRADGDQVSLDLQLGSQKKERSGGTNLDLNTRITTALGHPVVLGLAPTGKNTSVFVVQIDKVGK